MKSLLKIYQLIDNAFTKDNFLIKRIEGSEYTYIFFSSNGLFSMYRMQIMAQRFMPGGEKDYSALTGRDAENI